MPTDAGFAYLLDLLNMPRLTMLEHDWVFSDWADEPERTIGQRLYDLMAMRAAEGLPE